MAGLANVSFMDTPLVTWVQTFCDNREAVSYKELCEGVFLNGVMHEIDPRGLEVSGGSSVEERLNTWDILMKNIKAYYQDVLQQHIVMRLPHVAIISRDPESEKARKELLGVLLLVLGCAVQCERKEEFIGNIKQLDIGTQHAIVDNIQEITDDNKNVFAIELPEEHQDEVTQCLFSHLTNLIHERDGYVEEIKDLSQSVEELYQAQQQSEALKASLSSSMTAAAAAASTTPEKQHHTNVELAETKAKLRKLRQEYEEKSETAAELMEELDEARTQLNKLRAENSELLTDARSARAYRDELDIVKEKASRVDKYEAEVIKYKEKLNELEFFKARVDELREDNGILVETKIMLEDQLAASQKRIDTVVDLEAELLRLRQQVDDVAADRDQQRDRLQEVLEENARLELDKKSSFNESATLEEELIKAKTQLHSGVTNSLSAQMNETVNAKILRLELENQRLQKQVEEARQNALVEQAARTLELEKENHRLSKKVEKLQEGASSEQQNALQQVVANADLQRQIIEAEKTLETVRESSDRQVRELERERDLLTSTVETLRERNEKTLDLRVNETEKENQRLHERSKEMAAEVSRLEYENRQLLKSQERQRENLEKVRQLEDRNVSLENERDELKKNIATLKLTCDNYEKLEAEASDLEVDNQKLTKTVDKLKETVSRLEALGDANIALTVENQSLKRNFENARNSSSKVADLEQEKEESIREVQQLRKTVENLRDVQAKHEQLELDLLEMDTENQRLQRTLEARTRRVEELEQDSADLEGQVDKLSKDLENARVALRRLEALESEHKTMETDAAQTSRQKAALEKENARLKQAAEVKAAAIDELTSQVSSLQRQNREHVKQAERSKDAITRVRELEKENLELAQQAGVDKRTLATLREDLVNEKIRSQQLSNDLEKLNHDLEKVGINKEKLIVVQEATGPLADESKFQALEGLMQDALTKKMELKEERIQTLQGRLEESVNRNQRLQEELSAVRKGLAALEQRREEDALVRTTSPGYAKNASAPKREKPPPPPKPTMTQTATKDILELKDHLITVERTNASLETDNRNLTVQLENLQGRLRQAEMQVANSQHQLATHQEQFAAQQQQMAQLQVEGTTQRAQNTSLTAQNATLQRQHSHLESEHEQLRATCDELRANYEGLVSDHDALQNLHEQLTSEYEALISEHGSLKANHKQTRAELKSVQEQQGELKREELTLNELRRSVEQDREALRSESKSLGSLQADYVHIKQENILLRSAQEKAGREHADLIAEHKAVKAEYHQLQLRFTSQQGQLSDARNQINLLEVDIAKLESKCESLSQLNTKLEEENRTLMMQLQALLTQNQEMLTQTMQNKDHFHEEERAYMEKLSDLRRQKEKLEEKIMEQFKRYDPVKKKNRGFRANFVRRARGLLGRNRSKERHQTLDGSDLYGHDSPENSSLGSGSMGGENESPSERVRNKKMRERRNSAGDLLESPQLARQNKGLAQSTTALNMLRGSSSKQGPSGFNLRGAKSSENLLTGLESPRGRRRGRQQQPDADSMSSENSASRNNSEWPSRPQKMPLPGYDELIELRNTRRRHLLDSSSSSVFSSQPAGNSEDVRDGRDSSAEARLPGNLDDEDDYEDDDDDMISLNQFLNESNRSPKSRRKLLISKKIDPEEVRKENLETQPEPPPKFLTPRSPIIEKPEPKPKTPTTSRKGIRSKSEMNLSSLSKQTSGSSIGSFGLQAIDQKTSTPKQFGTRGNSTGWSYDNAGHQRGASQSSQQSASSGSDGRPSNSEPPPVFATIRPPTSGYNLQHRVAEYNGYERDRSGYGNGHSDSSYNSGAGNITRKSNSLGHSQQPPHPVRVPGGAGDSMYSSMNHGSARQNGGSHAVSRSDMMPHDQGLSYIPADGKQRSLDQQHHHSQHQQYSSSDPYPGATPMSSSSSSWSSSRQHRPDGSDLNNQYMPGNVRNLVQSYHMSVQQPGSGGSGSSGGGVGHQPPVPPPRRHRPLSAGGNLGSNLSGNMGGSGSAFSAPRPQSAVPGLSSSYNSGQNMTSGNNNNNNFAVDGSEKPTARPGSTPPRPNPTGREGAPKNSLWYEYGCV